MKTLTTIVITFLTFAGYAQGTVYEKGHTTKNGTYVAPHVQTKPNHTIKDNYSTKGNTNPYTGKQGTVKPTNTTGQTVHTGSRGGQYIYNSNGNKTYIKK